MTDMFCGKCRSARRKTWRRSPQYLLGKTGTPNFGGPIVTAGGLVFIGAAMDNYLRAFDAQTGEELWRGRLPAGGQATPMTYVWNGRQYVVIAAGGHAKSEHQTRRQSARVRAAPFDGVLHARRPHRFL